MIHKDICPTHRSEDSPKTIRKTIENYVANRGTPRWAAIQAHIKSPNGTVIWMTVGRINPKEFEEGNVGILDVLVGKNANYRINMGWSGYEMVNIHF